MCQGERPQEEKRADSGERAPQDVEEDDLYVMPVVQNRAAQLAPADAENHENQAMEDDNQYDGMEPQQAELRRSSCRRQPPVRLGSWTYF